MKRKLISAVTAAVMLSAMSMFSVNAFAEESSAEAAETTTATAETEEVTDSTAEVAETNSDDTTQATEAAELTEDIVADILDSVEDGNSANDDNKYYTDDYYDTEGNATLIKEEQVIYESEEMQFIAVTTKSGDVFYILINYSAASDENNVYFLNKVDTLDLYALLYMTDDEEENGIDLDRVKRAEDAALQGNSMNEAEGETAEETAEGEDTDTSETAPAQASGMNTTMLLGIGLVALIAVGFVGFKMLKKKPAAKTEVGSDFDDMDEDELNEDDEF